MTEKHNITDYTTLQSNKKVCLDTERNLNNGLNLEQTCPKIINKNYENEKFVGDEVLKRSSDGLNQLREQVCEKEQEIDCSNYVSDSFNLGKIFEETIDEEVPSAEFTGVLKINENKTESDTRELRIPLENEFSRKKIKVEENDENGSNISETSEHMFFSKIKVEKIENELSNIEPIQLSKKLKVKNNNKNKLPATESTQLLKKIAAEESIATESYTTESFKKIKVKENASQNTQLTQPLQKIKDEENYEAESYSGKPINPVFKEKEQNNSQLLPEGWTQVLHNSGITVYLHKKSRVCTVSRPYCLGPESTKYHKVPVNAIPCLERKKALEKEKHDEEIKKKVDGFQRQEDDLMQTEKVKSVEKNETLEALDIREYCKEVFKLKTTPSIAFKSWKESRDYSGFKKEERYKDNYVFPDGKKLFQSPTQTLNKSGDYSQDKCAINPIEKSYVSILNEYVQNTFRTEPTYEFRELQNRNNPHLAIAFIGNIKYSTAIGRSKKQAKSEAARMALEVLIPEMIYKIKHDNRFKHKIPSPQYDLSFDEITILDPRVSDFCAKATEPQPYEILMTCLQRNSTLEQLYITYDMKSSTTKEIECTMTLGRHTATVVGKNKHDAKQKGGQAILQSLHPSITTFGSLLRLYCKNPFVYDPKEKQKSIQVSSNKPNLAVLAKLREEMLKLNEKGLKKG